MFLTILSSGVVVCLAIKHTFNIFTFFKLEKDTLTKKYIKHECIVHYEEHISVPTTWK